VKRGVVTANQVESEINEEKVQICRCFTGVMKVKPNKRGGGRILGSVSCSWFPGVGKGTSV